MTLIQASTRANKAFERYLAITGGKLSLDKTIFYALTPEQTNRRRCYRSKKINEEIKLTENFGKGLQSLKQYGAATPHKMLGVYTDPACENTEQVLYMAGQAKEWNYRMLGSLLHSELKLLSFKSELLPKLKYPLPVSPLREKDIDKIIGPALVSIKHAIGLSRTTKNEVIFSQDSTEDSG